jgi:hypothetical protein
MSPWWSLVAKSVPNPRFGPSAGAGAAFQPVRQGRFAPACCAAQSVVQGAVTGATRYPVWKVPLESQDRAVVPVRTRVRAGPFPRGGRGSRGIRWQGVSQLQSPWLIPYRFPKSPFRVPLRRRLPQAQGTVSSSTAGPALPNPSLKLTRYGRRCKPGPRYPVHLLEPGLQRLPRRAA